MSGSTYKNKNDIKSSRNVDDMKEEGKGEGELYSPHHALKINPNNTQQQPQNNNLEQKNANTLANGLKEKDHLNDFDHHQEVNNNKGNTNTMVGNGVANEIKNKMSMVKERLMEKLASASVPSDALENARQYCEGVINDVTSAAHGLTKEALQMIKSHLADLLPSLSPLTSKMVDDSENEEPNRDTEKDESKETEGESYEEQKGKPCVSPASSLFSTYSRPVPSSNEHVIKRLIFWITLAMCIFSFRIFK